MDDIHISTKVKAKYVPAVLYMLKHRDESLYDEGKYKDTAMKELNLTPKEWAEVQKEYDNLIKDFEEMENFVLRTESVK